MVREKAVPAAEVLESEGVHVRPANADRDVKHADPGALVAFEILRGKGVGVSQPHAALVEIEGKRAQHVDELHERAADELDRPRRVLGFGLREKAKTSAMGRWD